MTSMYPKQPGYVLSHDPTKLDFKKISAMMLDKKINNELPVKKNISLPRSFSNSEEVKVREGPSLSLSQQTFINHYGNEIKEQFQPDWVKLDKQVLRFYGYFKESVVENKLENARLRKLVLNYYVVDDTISITEEKEMNSGIVQGPFLKRGRIKKNEAENEFYTFKDFVVGNDVYIYGKIIRIFDCDQYTREFFVNQGVEQPNRQPVPVDSFHEKVATVIVPKKDNLMKDYLEHRLGGGKVSSQKQFLENDRKVLRFYAKFDSLNYIIHYYLSDDTVEIREIYVANSGRDPFPLFLKRNKLPKKFSISQPGELDSTDYYKDSDIEPFMTLWAFNRPFKILGCDPQTQQYYMNKYGKKFPLGGFDDNYQKERPAPIIPPYNGFGDEEDSLGNCLRLEPKVKKKDYFKYIDNDKIILRFLARLNTKVPEDIDRRFLISFFMADDSIQVYEMQQRNSGIWEGKFLERRKYKNVENDYKYFTISDFEINKSIKINNFSLHIMDADDFTKKWLSDNLK